MPLFLPFTSCFFLMVRKVLGKLKVHLRFGPLYYEKGAKLSLQEEEWGEEEVQEFASLCFVPPYSHSTR